MLKIYNTLTKNKDQFKPKKAKEVKMYTCGVTVYDNSHIGHARSLYIFECFRNYLLLQGMEVKWVRNITDIDDKIIQKARELEDSVDLKAATSVVANKYIDSFYEDLRLLSLHEADVEPKATEHIPQMIAFVEQLIKKAGYEIISNVLAKEASAAASHRPSA